jgi:hypothetical protein
MLVEPSHRQLQGSTCIEAGGARVGVDRSLGFGSGFENGRPFIPEEREVGQDITLFLTLF